MSVTSGAIFDDFLAKVKDRPKQFEVTLSSGLTFVLKRADDWAAYQRILAEVKDANKAREKGHKIPAHEEHRPKNTSESEWAGVLAKAAMLEKFHLGFMHGEGDERGFVEGGWTASQFLAMAAYDGQALQTLLNVLDAVCGVDAVAVREMSEEEIKKKPGSASGSTSQPETFGDATPEN